MDMGQYMGVFVAECRELIESLNLSIVELERSADPAASIDEIFRVAHSFKGVSSTMGYERMAGLTHHMEHLLDIVRSGGRGVDQELITVLLECLDMLEQAVDAIEATSEEGIDPTVLVGKLEALAHEASPEAAPTEAAAAVASSTPLPDPASLPEGMELLHVRVDIEAACDSTSIRAYMAYAAIESAAEAVWSVPSADELDEWEAPHLDMLVIRHGDEAEREVLQALERIPELAGVQVRPFGADALASGVEQAVVEPLTMPAAELLAAQAPVVPVASVEASEPAASTGSAVKQRKSGTVRVDAERLDALMHLMGEVVVHRSAVEACIRDRDLDAAMEAVQELRRSTQSLQAEVMNVRMVPVESALMRMPRLVRDLSAKLDKDVELVITGAETEIDRSVVDALGEPLVHLVRNGLDHGIEGPDEREAAGKPRRATLGIGARHEGGNVVISVTDDGRGVDTQRVLARAIERGIVTRDEAALLDEHAIVELLFRPGFSTAEVATDVSGRGVGMDAVRAMCREWGGDVEIESTFGVGSVARIRIPLTLAVMTVLVVRAGAGNVAIPIDRIERTIRLADCPRADVGGSQRMIRLDEGVIGELDLAAAVSYGSDDEPVFGVIVHGAGGRRVVLAVRGLVGEHEAVTKPMPPALGREAAFMGAAVQGDGSVVLIVDCDYLVDGGGATGVGMTSGSMAAVNGWGA
jgi:two-component system chemotaxis sensor kinase CheA